MFSGKRNYFFIAGDEDEGERLDSYLAEEIGELSRSRIQKAIKAGDCQVNERVVKKSSYRVRLGDRVSLVFSPPEPLRVEPEKVPLDIIYEDELIVVVNKSPGMVTHPAPGHSSGTLVNALLAHCSNLSGIGGVIRPGIVHRLDAGTSGLLVVAKNDVAHISLSRQIMERKMKRRYVAVVWGELKSHEGVIDAPIGRSKRDRKKMAVVADGRRAITHYSVIDTFPPFQYIKLSLETGRTHQIRVHLSHIGHPVFGDPQYGGRRLRKGKLTKEEFERATEALKIIERQALHAISLEFLHPGSGKAMNFEAPMPEDFRKLLEYLSSTG